MIGRCQAVCKTMYGEQQIDAIDDGLIAFLFDSDAWRKEHSEHWVGENKISSV